MEGNTMDRGPCALVIPADGAPYFSTGPAPGPTTTHTYRAQLEWLQALVGGYIELIEGHYDHDAPRWHVYVNEEGRIHGLSPNEPATELAHGAGARFRADMLVGTVVFLGHNDIDEADVPGDLVSLARLLFGPDAVPDWPHTTRMGGEPYERDNRIRD